MLGFLHATPAASQSAPDGTALLARVQAQYDRLDGLRASFEQTVSSDAVGSSSRVSGELWLQDNRYRIETGEQTLVTDGTTSWVYTPATEQVIVNDVVEDPAVITPKTLFTDYAERYAVESATSERRAGAPHTRLDLVPTDASAPFEAVTLWVRDADALITRLRLTDPGGSVITIDLDALEVNPSFEPGAFTFTPSDATEVIDLRT